MKTFILPLLGSVAIFFTCVPVARAQSPAREEHKASSAPLLETLFSGFDFTATSVTIRQGRSSSVKMEKLGKMIRTEENLADISGIGSDPAALEHVRKMGLDVTITLMNLETHYVCLIYPGKKAYVEIATHSPSESSVTKPRIEETLLGQETVGGHPCVKKKWRLEDSGGAVEAIVWLATDLKNFPIKNLVGTGENQVTSEFKDIRLGSPSQNLFVPPTDYLRCASMEDLMLRGKR